MSTLSSQGKWPMPTETSHCPSFHSLPKKTPGREVAALGGWRGAAPSLPQHPSSVFRACQTHTFSLRVPSQQTVHSVKGNQKENKQNKHKTNKNPLQLTFAGKLVLSDKTKDEDSSCLLLLLEGFHIFQKLFNEFITSVFVIESQEILVGKFKTSWRIFCSTLPLPQPGVWS